MLLPDAFNKFHDAISLGAKPTAKIESAASGLITYVCGKYGLAEGLVFLQGSYPNDTAVEPENSDGEYDVDLVCVAAQPWMSPEDALNDLEATLAQSAVYEELLKKEGSRKKPCVRLRYADDEVGGFHVDVVPSRASTSADPQAPLEVPRRGDGWHDTAPQQYTDWCRDQGLRFARTVKMLKRWREHHQPARLNIKSIVLQVLAANNLGTQSSDAEALVSTLEAIQAVLAESPDRPPRVQNPVLDAEDLAARWEPAAYKNFRRELGEAVELARRALDSIHENESHDLWCELLGDDFPAAPSDPGMRTRVPPAAPPPGAHPTQAPPRRERYGA
jgi:SMODS domain-containing protein